MRWFGVEETEKLNLLLLPPLVFWRTELLPVAYNSVAAHASTMGLKDKVVSLTCTKPSQTGVQFVKNAPAGAQQTLTNGTWDDGGGDGGIEDRLYDADAAPPSLSFARCFGFFLCKA